MNGNTVSHALLGEFRVRVSRQTLSNTKTASFCVIQSPPQVEGREGWMGPKFLGGIRVYAILSSQGDGAGGASSSPQRQN